MQNSSSQQHLSKTSMPLPCHKELSNSFQQESCIPPPPYKSELKDECLPRYMESSSLELEGILDRFPPRWDNQRVDHYFSNADKKQSSSSLLSAIDQTGQLLDRMEDYRHTEQEWVSLNQTRMNQVIQNMYHMQHRSNPKKQLLSLSSAKSRYQQITISIAKEREHFVHQIKKIRSSSSALALKQSKPSSSSCADEFDFFLNHIHDTTTQSQMSNQRATLMIPTV
ncbi:hypothetical protein BCR42DRAFT_485543 [Absidia repens]|uniref:Uncharacterized protein n=1 Tax=Absidia repens TaxID=90262 RepID=A0A1X2J0L7_9FUNG|nr:hypothetical protein BCR42DRAFT_485543 [Absidia repens]